MLKIPAFGDKAGLLRGMQTPLPFFPFLAKETEVLRGLVTTSKSLTICDEVPYPPEFGIKSSTHSLT